MQYKVLNRRNMSTLEEERDSLRRELIGVQEMLAFVLQEVAEPVRVSKETLKQGLPNGLQIAIDDTEDAFVFSLVEIDNG